MEFSNINDAQLYAVQRVISRKPLDEQLSVETDPIQIASIKSQIRQLQWELTQANKYIISNALMPLGYDKSIFSSENYVKTPWENEAEISGTYKYFLNESIPLTQEELIQRNSDLLSNINVLIFETKSLLNENKINLDKAYALPDTNIDRQTQIDFAQNNIKNLTKQLNDLIKNYALLTEQDFVLPSETITQTNDIFSQGIRNSIKTILNRKSNYIYEFGDIDATLSMRRQALDMYYTAKTDSEKYAAMERMQKVISALSPDVPISRKNISLSELYMDAIIEDIAVLNIELAPKQTSLDFAFNELKEADASGDPILIEQKKQLYNAANDDYNVTFNKIRLAYDSLLGRHKAFGVAMSFPGSDNIQKYEPSPNPAYYGESAYKLIWDTKDKKFVSPDEATADKGRYLSTTFTDKPPSDKQTDAERMQSILSQQYLQTAKAAADYEYQKTTQDLVYVNNNRTQINQEKSSELFNLQAEFESKKSDSKNPMTDKEFLQYQTKIQEIATEIENNKKIISDNNKAIDVAKEKRIKDSNPTISWNEKQEIVKDTAISSIKAEIPNPITEGQKVAASLYDAQAERIIAQKQHNSAESIRDDAAKKLETIKSINPNDPSIPALEEDLRNKNNILSNKQTVLNEALKNEKNAANNAQNLIANTPEKDKQKILEQYGLKESDVNRSLLISDKSSANSANIRQNMITNTTSIYQKQIDAERKSLNAQLTSVGSELQRLDEKRKLGPLSPAEEKAYEQNKSRFETLQQELQKNENRNASSEATNAVDKSIQEITNETKYSNTGFEGINNGAPFYMQFPTLNSISDFKLKNGIDPYGNKSPNEIARDAIVFKIFETTPGIDRAEPVQLDNGGKYIRNIPTKTNINTLGSFTIYPAHEDGKGDWLTQTHNHTYGSDSGGIVSLANNILDGVGVAENILSLANAGMNALESGSLHGNMQSGNAYNRRIERLDYYQSTESQRIPIRFNLFTRNNFLNDVYRPIMFLTALSYPKRAMQGDLGNMTGDILNKTTTELRKVASEGNSFAQYALQILEATGDPSKIAQTINEAEQYLSSFGGIGPFRYFVSKRPEYLTVRHVSGLFYFPVAVITSFKYTFKGPWYNYDGTPLSETKDLDTLISTQIKQTTPSPEKTFKEKVNQIFTETGQNIRDTFRPPPKPVPTPSKPEMRPKGTPGGLLQMSESDMKFIQSKGLPYAYPSWAECEITIKNAVPFFRDDFMQLYYASQSGGKDLVSVTQKMTNQEQFASGGRKTSENQVDDAWKEKTTI